MKSLMEKAKNVVIAMLPRRIEALTEKEIEETVDMALSMPIFAGIDRKKLIAEIEEIWAAFSERIKKEKKMIQDECFLCEEKILAGNLCKKHYGQAYRLSKKLRPIELATDLLIYQAAFKEADKRYHEQADDKNDFYSGMTSRIVG